MGFGPVVKHLGRRGFLPVDFGFMPAERLPGTGEAVIQEQGGKETTQEKVNFPQCFHCLMILAIRLMFYNTLKRIQAEARSSSSSISVGWGMRAW
jgi:hypothetical protein